MPISANLRRYHDPGRRFQRQRRTQAGVRAGYSPRGSRGFHGRWRERAQLFPGEQARIIQLLVRRVTVTAEGLVIDLRTDGIAGVMRDLMTLRPLVAAE